MTQLYPSAIYYEQALVRLAEFKSKYESGEIARLEDIEAEIQQIISDYVVNAGMPLLNFIPVVKGEPALSAKINYFLKSLENDTTILQHQTDLLKASNIFTHNHMAVELLKARNENSQAMNRLKTLHLYSSASDENLIVFGDYLINNDYHDNTNIPTNERITFIESGGVTLGWNGTNDVMTGATITILPTSNGIVGNNQEIEDPSLAQLNPLTEKRHYIFKAETNRRADMNSLLDQEPNTWFEYEKYYLTPEQKAQAGNFNFTYKLSNDPQSNTLIEWANGVENGVLRLDLQLDFGIVKTINKVSLFPYGLEDDKNPPIKIKSVQTSPDGTSWTLVAPGNVWISTDPSLETVADIKRLQLHKGVWVFDARQVRYVRFSIEQPQSYDTNVGHMQYIGEIVETHTGSSTYNVVEYGYLGYFNSSTHGEYNEIVWSPVPGLNWNHLDGNSPSSTVPTSSSHGDSILGYFPDNYGSSGRPGPQDTRVVDTITEFFTYTVTKLDKVAGPVPPLSEPDKYYKNDTDITGSIKEKHREYFPGKRWAIGLRDMQAEDIRYKPSSVLVTRPFRINGIVDRVALEADVTIPREYTNEDVWVRFYISPNDGLDWFPISRIQDDFFGIPEIIAFNDPLPQEFWENGITYHQVGGTVNSVRLKIEMSRPENLESTTPIVHSYKVKIRKR